MALFGNTGGRPNRSKALQRVTNRDWSDRDEMNDALRDLSQFKDLKADELVLLLTSSETTVRFFAEKVLRERHEGKLLEQIFELAQHPRTDHGLLMAHLNVPLNFVTQEEIFSCLMIFLFPFI